MQERQQTIENPPILLVQADSPQDESTGDFHYRTYAPGIAMAQCEGVYVINLTNLHHHKELLMRRADLLILNNICDPDILPLIRERKDHRKPTVYELCDDLDAVQEGNPVCAFYRNPENGLLIKRLARYCDALQFSSPELQRNYGFLNPCSAVFPNQILEVPPERRYSRRPEVIVGWGGSAGHLQDMALIAGPLIRWIVSRGDVRLHLMCGDEIWGLFGDLPPHLKKRTFPGSLSKYCQFLGTLDVAIAALQDNAFNRSRSDVKFLEYAVHGTVPVMQAAGPYPSVVRHGETGYLFHDAGDLVGILDNLSNDIRSRVVVSIAARDYVLRERFQLNHGRERVDFYRTLLAAHFNASRGSAVTDGTFESLSSIPGARRRGRHLLLASSRFESLLHNGLLASRHADPSSVAPMFLEAAQLEPDSYLPHLFGAYCLGDTIGSLERAIARNPRSIKAWILLGDAFSQLGNVTRALECFRSAMKIFPQYELPYLKTIKLFKSGEYSQKANTGNHHPPYSEADAR